MTNKSPLRRSLLRQIFPAPWPWIWLFIFCVIFVGIFLPSSPIIATIKVTGIFLCFFYAVCYFHTDRLLCLALLVTFIADIILAINNTAEIGILCFFIAQLIHAWRLNPPRRLCYVLTYALFSFALILLSFITNFLPPLFAICPLYLAALVANIDVSWRWQNRNQTIPRAYFATSGFMLFLCCDICTCISFLSLNHLLPAYFYGLANFFAWFFYYPSQVLISNSSTKPRTLLCSSKPT